MINLSDLEILDGKPIYDTNNDTYVVYEDKETIINASEYKLLGFLNGYSYANHAGYLLKSTSYGAPVHEIYLDVDHGTFIEGMSYAYFWKDKIMYKVNERMEIEWEEEFDDYIRQIIMDHNGYTYIIFKNSRTIKKYNKEGNMIYFMDDSDDPTHFCRLYCGFVSEGGGHLYVTGVDFFDDGKYVAYIDHYDTRRAKRIERMVKNYYDYSHGVEIDDPRYTYSDIYVDGDYLYLYGRSYIEKYNIKMRLMWRFYPYGFDTIGSLNNIYEDNFHEIVFDNRKFKDRIYFCSSIDTNNKRCAFGKLSTNGHLNWQITDKSEAELKDVEFNIAIYNDEIYMTAKRDIEAKASFVLSLDENRVLFETRNGELVRIVQNNIDEIYDSSNYTGYYTIADKLKDGVPKIIDIPIRHDTGNIMVDEENNLIVAWDNPYWEDPNNYDYFTLIGTIPLDDVNLLSIIQTRYGLYVRTKNGSYIKTKQPYEPEQDIEFIIDDERNKIRSLQEYDLIRNRTRGAIYFYILNDEYKFGQDIVTKVDGITIITKRKGYSIIRKKRTAYKYVLKKLIDIDIIVEHMKQENILDSMLPYYVDRLRHHRTRMIEDMQKCLSPVMINLDYHKTYSYRYDGYDYPIRFANTQIFMCNNFPWMKKRKNWQLLIEPLAALVANEEVQPFLLFVGGKVVKWSDILVVRDWKFTYVILNNTPENDERIDCILFPCVIRYGEDANILPDKPHMYFNSDRLFTEDTSDIAVRVEILDKDVNGSTVISTGSQTSTIDGVETTHDTIFEVPVREYDEWSNMNNIFIFGPDGKFVPDSRFYLTNYGKNMYSYEFDEAGVIYKTFYFNKANWSGNMIFDIPNQEQVKADLQKKVIPATPIPEDNFKVPFDFRLSRDKSYLTNISEATAYIMKYNMALLIDYYRDQSNIKSYIYSGEKILSLSSDSLGRLYMPRLRTKQGLFDYVMIFINDHLYEFMHEITYVASDFYVPLFDHVRHGDKVEILHFGNVDNSYSTLTVDTDPDYLGDNLRYDNFLLFGNAESGRLTYPDFDVESGEQYQIDFDYKNNFNQYGRYESTSIKLDDFYYYNRKINICSKHQFRSMYYNVLQDLQSEFVLDPSFRFCHYSNQYMIFVNGLKLDQDDWRLTIPERYVPRNNITVTLNKPLARGDVIHIFYLPNAYEEIILKNTANKNGDIILDASLLDYSFDNELFLIFIDGHKIIKDDIQNISSNRVRIKNRTEWESICICKYLNPDRILQKVFSYGDHWTKSIEGLSEDDYEQLFIKSGVKK